MRQPVGLRVFPPTVTQMKDADENTKGQSDRAATVEEPTGDQHIATRSVVLHRSKTKKIMVLAPLGRHVRTKVWKKPAAAQKQLLRVKMQPRSNI